ncbi:hypothetical protein BS50DRAFT_651281 [Corynespora cassiicola Philippines]|uniref:Aminoglycoside phosphotransferase domain-containing protein n=1 Tax=Corynespora cassiicola Philippines TaxID=1448308 RepID=A0A2T2N8T8_CORCC|nr:hypothetical protein BS50DRAFT_651281 [Corynespora cassiicola Philippines]
MTEFVRNLMLKHYGFDSKASFKEHYLTNNYETVNMLYHQRSPVEEWVKIPFPYYAIDPSMPPIPTREDVDAATPSDFDPDMPTHVFRVHGVYAVKWGPPKSIVQEAENLIFLQDHAVRTPKVYACFSHDRFNAEKYMERHNVPRSAVPQIYFLVTDWIEGIGLDTDKMEAMSDEAKVKLCDKIGQQLALLRSIPPPHPEYYGRVNDQPFPRWSRGVPEYKDESLGPYHTYEDYLDVAKKHFEIILVDKMFWKGEENWEASMSPEAECILGNFHNNFRGPGDCIRSTLTHRDLNHTNVLLVPPKGSGEPASVDELADYELWIIDWETMVWAPAWYEMGAAFRWWCSDFSKPFTRHLWAMCKHMKPVYWTHSHLLWMCRVKIGGLL